MKIIVCLDDYGGMLFNFRRQSRDRVLISDVMSNLGSQKLYITEFSEILFSEYEGKYEIVKDFSNLTDENCVCFVENVDVSPFIDSINEVTVYNWNRVYPRDFVFDINLEKEGFSLMSSHEFEGYSHENIRKEVYKR
ncbi:MAG: ribonuclease Z [Ruminococcaceae bacterium]|nr:ribonuclease Z [Oscillospiraceae bacterium]